MVHCALSFADFLGLNDTTFIMFTCMWSTQLRTWALLHTVGQVFFYLNNIYSLHLFQKLEAYQGTYASKVLQDFCTDKHGTCKKKWSKRNKEVWSIHVWEDSINGLQTPPPPPPPPPSPPFILSRTFVMPPPFLSHPHHSSGLPNDSYLNTKCCFILFRKRLPSSGQGRKWCNINFTFQSCDAVWERKYRW